MKNLKSFENFINEDLHRSQDDPSALIGSMSTKPTKWDDVNLTDDEIGFLVFIYNNFGSGGPVADKVNWKYIDFEHGKKIMNDVIEGKYKELKYDKVAPIATKIINKMGGPDSIDFNTKFLGK